MTLESAAVRSLYGSTADVEAQRRSLCAGSVPVAVYGLGKMGLPLAAIFAATTGNATGVDIDEAVVDQIRRGECPVTNEPGLASVVSETVSSGALRATTDSAGAATDASVHVVIVPTTLQNDDTADLSALEAALTSIGSGLSSGDVVLVESTVPPGTCRALARPLLEDESELEVGEFGIAFCPERTASGQAIEDIRISYPKIVGGIDEESTRVAALIYDELSENRVIPVSDTTTAECVKLFEGVYRDVNIALANELARIGEELGVDTVEAIAAANTQPYCDIHDPGAGVGGHCIPYYPYFLTGAVETETTLLRTARAVNESMPAYTAGKLFEGFAVAGIEPAGATVAVLGVAYRPGVAETRESPALPIIDRLIEAGVDVVAIDPVLDGVPDRDVPLVSVEALSDMDLDGAILVTAHPEFERLDWDTLPELVVVDGRNVLDLENTEHAVYTVGKGR